MLGISYGEIFLLIGATAALVGPKDLPVITRTAGRLSGRAIGNVQVARARFESVMHQTQARQVHKELQETMAQLEAIRHEIQSISFMNPGPLTTRIVDNIAGQPPVPNVDDEALKHNRESKVKVESIETSSTMKGHSSPTSTLSDIHSQEISYAKLAESHLTGKSMDEVLNELKDERGKFFILPISAESANLLPSKKDDLRGWDILLEAVVEEDVAWNAHVFFSQTRTQIKNE